MEMGIKMSQIDREPEAEPITDDFRIASDDDIAEMKALVVQLDILIRETKKADRAGLDVKSDLQQLDEQKIKLNKAIRAFTA